MTFVITSGQLTRRAEFYHQLAQLTSAGLGIIPALAQIERNPPAISYRRPIRQLVQHLEQGYTLSESMRQVGHWISAFEIALVQAGEQSGRLDACFGLLANYYGDRARLARQVVADLLYPLFLFHFAIFIFPFPRLFVSGNWMVYAEQTLGVLMPLYALVALMIYVAQSRHGERWRGLVESLVAPIPVLGTARSYLALARLSAALEALLSAGVTVIEAWELAAAASGSPALRRTVQGWRPRVNGGQTPAEALNASGRFPELFASQYTTGEVSGKLDEVLRRMHVYYQEEGSRKLHAVAQWTPRAIYLVVALLIAYRIVNFWTSYFKQVQNAGGF